MIRRILQTISGAALLATIAPPLAYLVGRMDLSSVQQTMLAATVVWFASAPFWMGRAQTTSD